MELNGRPNVCVRLRVFRRALGQTQEQMSRVFCLTQGGYGRYEINQVLDAEMIAALCAIYRMPPEWFILGEEGRIPLDLLARIHEAERTGRRVMPPIPLV